MTNPKHEIAYVRRQIELASRRLAAINFSMTRSGHDPKLAAESECLHTQIASLKLELTALAGKAA